MDDDVVWLADGALEAMLEEKLRGNYLYISGNIINHSSMGLVCATLRRQNLYCLRCLRSCHVHRSADLICELSGREDSLPINRHLFTAPRWSGSSSER